MNHSDSIEILLVEDSPTDRLMAQEALRTARLLNNLHCVDNGEEALAFLRRQGKYADAPRPGLILLDLNMPKMDGREVLCELKADPKLKYIPVIVLTTSDDERDILSAYGAHANSYITKPVDFKNFTNAIAAIGDYWLNVVTLPPSEPSETSLELTVQRGRTADGLRVLLLEDDPVSVLLLKDALKRASGEAFTLTHATQVKQLEELLRPGTEFDIIITDLGLSDMQGLETYRQVRLLAPNVPVIVLTGDRDESLGIRAVSEGAQDYLVKGQVSGRGIARAIRYAIDRSDFERRLRHSQRLEAVGRLAGGIAHDFNNVLTIVQGEASLIADGGLTSEEISSAAFEILQAAERAASLTRQLLTFGRRQTIHLRYLDLNEVVGGFVRIIERILGEGVELKIVLADEPLILQADWGMLEQVLFNLCANARDAMPAGGSLTLSTGLRKLGLREASESTSHELSDFAYLTVSDTGEGIEPASLGRIFDPFFTTKALGEGTGLGLATVYSIVQQHQGRIDVNSGLGEGTRFDVLIPLSGPPNSVDPKIQSSSGGSKGRGETVLVVEDENSLRALSMRFLSRSGYNVLEASSAGEALSLLEREGFPSIDLLITDLVMPGEFGGMELSKRLKKRYSDLEIIYTSGYSTDFQKSGGELIEGVNFLQKPFMFESLLELARQRLNGT